MGAAHVYENNGFSRVQNIEMDFPEKFASRPKPRLVFMHKAAKG